MTLDRAVERLRDRAAQERGFTLVELLVAMSLLSLIIIVSFTVVAQTVSATKTAQARSTAVDDARAATSQIQRQVRSANVIKLVTGYNLVVYTQLNGASRCAQWQVDTVADVLKFRSWSTSYLQDGDVTTWQTVARNVVNTTATADTPFVVSSDASYGGRLLTINLLVQASGSPAATVVKTSVTGRNTSFGYTQSICTGSIPSGG